MNAPSSIVVGWLLALPGLAILLSLFLVATPIFGALGCRTAGILSIRCSTEIVDAVMEIPWIVVIVSGAYVAVAAPVALFAIVFVGWRIVVALKKRRAAGG
jgi:hypothetical protein